MKHKKLLLNCSIIPLAIAAPTVMAVSCGESIIQNNTKHQKIISKKAYSLYSISQLKKFFDKFVTKFDVEGLKLQALKASDAGLIAFGGYMVDSEGGMDQLKAKERFANNIKIFKTEFNALFDAAIGKPELATNIISPIIKHQVKDQKITNFLNIVIENVLKKIKMVLDNVIDTIINIEDPIVPDFIGNSKELGTLKDVKDGKISGISYSEILDSFKAGFDDKELFKRSGGKYDMLHKLKPGWFGLPSATRVAIEGVFGTDLVFPKPKQELKDSAWQIGVKALQKNVETKPGTILVYKNTKTNKIYLKENTKTNKLANELKTNLKYNENHIGAAINDKILSESESLIKKVVDGKLGILSILGEIGNISKILKDKPAIHTFIERAELILEDFGRAMQFTELNLQMIASNLLGDKAQYYGGMEIKNNKYKLLPDSFTSPQFSIYKYENYKPYNETVSKSTIENGMKIKAKAIVLSATINVLETFKNITRDPLSNYTVGLFQIVQLLTKDMKDMEVGV